MKRESPAMLTEDERQRRQEPDALGKVLERVQRLRTDKGPVVAGAEDGHGSSVPHAARRDGVEWIALR